MKDPTKLKPKSVTHLDLFLDQCLAPSPVLMQKCIPRHRCISRPRLVASLPPYMEWNILHPGY